MSDKKKSDDIVVVTDFVNVIGSVIKNDGPNDIDILVKAEKDQDKQSYHIMAENIRLLISNSYDEDVREKLNFISNPQCVHDDYMPLYDLVLRKKEHEQIKKIESCPVIGPENGALAFIGYESSNLDLGRNEPFTGPDGAVFIEKYLKPLGLNKRDIILGNIDEGNIKDKLIKRNPVVLVALGKKAKNYLGDMADLVMPHPSIVRKAGDSGEVSRKLKRISKIIKQKISAEGDETSEEAATKNWEENWDEMLPKSGRGTFVYQQHWRGLTEEETKMSDEELMGTDNSVHGDLRLSNDKELFGWSIFLGDTAKNRSLNPPDRFLTLEPNKDLRMDVKLPHPRAWLDVAKTKPLIVAPEGTGATEKTWAKFFQLARGEYKIGVARKHSIELFLDLNGQNVRYLARHVPIGGKRRVWMIENPADQTPIADKEKLGDVIQELRKKNQKFLFWGKPGEATRKINVETGRIVKSAEIKITKADEERKVISGVVLSPHQIDSHGDWISPKEIQDTAFEWMRKSRVISLHHAEGTDAYPVESFTVEYPSEIDQEKAFKNQPHKAFRRKYGNDIVRSGDWVLSTKLTGDLWEAFKRGEIQAYSIEGFGVKETLDEEDMPKIEYIDQIEATDEKEEQS